MSEAGPVILVVDDERHIVEVLGRRLESAGFAVEKASNVREALEVLERVRPALIVTDLQMPGGSGLDLAQEVRSRPALARVPIILLSARGFLADVRRLESLLITAVMEKPFSARKVCEEVSRLVGHRAREDGAGVWLNHPDAEAA